jgi:hypothetical protein
MAALLVGALGVAPASLRAEPVPEHLPLFAGGRRVELHRRAVPRPHRPQSVSLFGIRRELGDRVVRQAVETRSAERLLVVVTTQELASESLLLQSYIDWRLAGGWEVVLGLEADWDQPTGRDGDDRAARIRAWLQRLFAARGAGFLLLVGDPHPESGEIPMRRVEPLAHLLGLFDHDPTLMEVPTDAYFADLDSDWDCDGDGVLGEYPDDSGEGCTDWGPELLVGRLPVYDGAADLDLQLAQILAYEQAADKTYRARALFAGAFGGFRGQPSPAGDGTVYGADEDLAVFLARAASDVAALDGVVPVRLFEDAGVVTSRYAHEAPLDLDTFWQEWGRGAATVAWGGHGSPVSAHRQVWEGDDNGNALADGMEVASPAFADSAWADLLADAPAAMVAMMSCLNGYPEEPDNLGAALLGRGSVATFSASRSAIGEADPEWEPRPHLASATTVTYTFVLRVQQGESAGEAAAYTRWALPADGWDEYYEGYGLDAIGWLTKAEYNLYGDPTLRLERCAADADCDDGLPCTGVERCASGYCVHTDVPACGGHRAGTCVTERCSKSTGACEELPALDGVACDDASWCTTGDVCRAGACVGTPRPCTVVPGYTTTCSDAARDCLLVPEETADDPGGCGALPKSAWTLLMPPWLARSCRRRPRRPNQGMRS